jgi:two-component system, NtrC family, sensor kinase
LSALAEKLPSILVLAVLVGAFISLRKHASSVRIRLWTVAWALIFLHFFVEAFEGRTGAIESVLESIDLATLELSGIVFVMSLTRAATERTWRIALFALLVLPTAFHAFAVTFDWHIRWVLAGSLAVIACGAAFYAMFESGRRNASSLILAVGLLATGAWAIKNQLAGSPDFAVNAILTLSFALSGVLSWKCYPRRSPGVIAVAGGFLCWGAVFPVATALADYLPKLQVNPELWNVPKLLVAFGMVLAVLENKSEIIEQARVRECSEKSLLLRLSDISSRLLAGKDPVALSKEIAVTITEATSFRRAALFLSAEDGSLRLAGASGLPEAEIAVVQERTSTWKSQNMKVLCAQGTQVGSNSFHISEIEQEILVPLVSPRGSHLGCLWMSGSASDPASNVSEIAKLEMLASDLAVTIENARLHHRLMRSEKLAALGQLVAGVAHELNNPLTGIMGYTELIGEEVEKESTVKRVQKLANEGRRMKRIIDGLLRFARQNNPANRSADLEAALREVIDLREYDLRKLGIHTEIKLESKLPGVAIGEDELKQVLLNILNNAIDAVGESAKREIRVSASRQNDCVAIRFDDSGPGFTDTNRAFDPFYTTKPVGKGTGLGLSICYGIAQECGGEITIANEEPYGASVRIRLPIAVPLSAAPLAAALNAAPQTCRS